MLHRYPINSLRSSSPVRRSRGRRRQQAIPLPKEIMDEHNSNLAEGAEAERAISRIIQARRLRSDLLGSNLFSDPAWDLLLALFLAELRQHRLTTSQLTKATSTSTTSALRWLDALERQGWILRRRAPLDGRKLFVELSESVSVALRQWVRQI